MRFLVHGAAGFVGSALISHLNRTHVDELILTDRRPLEDWADRLAEVWGSEVTALQSDRLSDLDLPQIDVAMVLAGQTDVDEGLLHPSRSFQANTEIAIDVSEWLLRSPGTRVVYMSSDETLGESYIPLSEDAVMAPTQPYAASKATAEMIIDCYRRAYGLEFVVLRSCNLVGVQNNCRKLIPTAVEYLTEGQPVPVYGDGKYRREWLAVEDLCEAIRVLAFADYPLSLYHCSSGVHLGVIEVIELVAEALGVEPKWSHVADRLVHDRCYSMDSSRLRSFGWSPRYEVTGAIKLAAKTLAGAL